MNKALIIRTGQQHGQRYIPRLSSSGEGELDPSDLATHRLSLEDGPRVFAISSTRRRLRRLGLHPVTTDVSR